MSVAKAQESTDDKLTRPFVLNRETFKTAVEQCDLRTDLRVSFGDGTYRFHLTDAAVQKLEMGVNFPSDMRNDMVRVGIGEIYARLAKGRAVLASGQPILAAVGSSDLASSAFFRRDVQNVIGHALVGGGEVDAAEAAKLIERYVADAPLAPLATLAFAIVGVRLFGREPDPETGA